MNPNDSRRLIEVLRSGVPSRQASAYFTNARVKLRHEIEHTLDQMCENGQSSCKIITGKYGEGKTHLLNTVFNMASERNMVVSMIPLSKEIPFISPPPKKPQSKLKYSGSSNNIAIVI